MAAIVHADIKLNNFIVFPNRNGQMIDGMDFIVKLTDFGLAYEY